MRYLLSIDYDDFNVKSYRGVVISDGNNDKIIELVRVNTGDIKLDEEVAIDKLFDVINEEECDIHYMSSYDHYFMDFDYENDPKYRAEVDAVREELKEESN